MKQLTCEMCGSTELVKKDGVFVCQSCGTKYSVEEAKKMMIEGPVDVQGTVKVDTSDKVKNLYKMARRAKDDNNAELAAKYYEMITFEIPRRSLRKKTSYNVLNPQRDHFDRFHLAPYTL